MAEVLTFKTSLMVDKNLFRLRKLKLATSLICHNDTFMILILMPQPCIIFIGDPLFAQQMFIFLGIHVNKYNYMHSFGYEMYHNLDSFQSFNKGIYTRTACPSIKPLIF